MSSLPPIRVLSPTAILGYGFPAASFAAGLAMNPDVLLLDEPTNSLDTAHVDRLVDALGRLDKAMVIVSHDRPVLDTLATRALAMRDGALHPVVLHRYAHTHEHGHIHL